MLTEKSKLLNSPLFFSGILFLIVLLITLQSFMLPPKTFYTGGSEYTHYNNYIIFKQSWFHLMENKDLYQPYWKEYWDLYKYSPTFAVFMAPFAILPNAAGLLCWNLLNVLVLFFALWKLPWSANKKRLFALGFVLIELFSSVHNAQSNALIAGLIIFAFLLLEKKQLALASLLIVLTVFIKLFGLVAFVLFIFYPGKLKAIFYTIGWTLLLAALPLLFISSGQLILLYQNWFHLLQNDHSIYVGLSVTGWLQSWFGMEAKLPVLIAGIVLFLLPLIKYKYFSEFKFRIFFLSSILLWIVIFNHKAESPTFVIAVSGIAIWFFMQKTKTENTILLLVVLLFTILSSTDLFPANLRKEFIEAYVLKAVPCILIWLKITMDLLLYKPEKMLNERNVNTL
ncbi:MAG: glycosyltransferase family 87 protein [Bacteroidia bacterium]